MQVPAFPESPFKVQLSFSKVIEDLEKTAADPASERAGQARTLLADIARQPELREGITDVSQVEENRDLIGRLFADYFPAALTRNEIKAISLPYRDIIFNHTERFRNILKAAGEDFEINIRGFGEHQSYVLSCCLILNQYYQTHLDFSRPLFYDIPAANGITKHYRILYNADFLEILPTDRSVWLSQEDINLLINNYGDLGLWKEKFPPESWLLKGFAIMTLVDATVENAVSLFKEKLLGIRIQSLDFRQSVESIFQSIYQIPDIKIGFTLFDQEEGQFRPASFGQPLQSYMLPDAARQADQQVLCFNSNRRLIEEQDYFAISDTLECQAQDTGSCLVERLLAKNIRSFILAPVVKNQVLLGVLEVVCPRPKVLNSINANKLAVVMPFLTDTLERLSIELQNQVQAVIQDKFTTIHASVYWKFRAEAQNLIYSRQAGKDYQIQEIAFPEVYPLYGQVDIKGSSEARNQSVQQDLQAQLKALLPVLKALDQQKAGASFAREVQQLEYFLHDLALTLKTSTEQQIEHYLATRVHPRLTRIAESDAALAALTDPYFRHTDKDNGDFHTCRRRYDTSVSMINGKMARILDKRQPEAQALFPHYYERFKTDGVEHNLYVGASIWPKQKFHIRKLFALRLWQLRVLCEMTRAHHLLQPSLPYPLEVTTLVLVYHATIAIRFKMDEKHFDVDGSYNARYEMVKKRLDKAFMKDTHERITQEGKITIVYANETDQQEYEQYLALLQAEHLLEGTVEHFEVEDLQGVSGLKALRVKIANLASP